MEIQISHKNKLMLVKKELKITDEQLDVCKRVPEKSRGEGETDTTTTPLNTNSFSKDISEDERNTAVLAKYESVHRDMML